MKDILTVPSFLCVVLLLGCSPIAVTTDFDRATDFQKLHTFQWLPESETAPKDAPQRFPASGQFMEERIRKAVIGELTAKGYRAVSENPDFLIAHQTSVRRREWKSDFGRTIQYRTEYQEGTLVLDFLAPGTQALIWQGVAEGALGEFPSPEERDKRVADAVRKMLKKFPPSK